MAHSKSYENNVIQFRLKSKVEPLIRLAAPKNYRPVVNLTDGTRKEGNAMIKFIINTYLVADDDTKTFYQSVRKGIFLYCSLINQFNISLAEAEVITKICMNAIQYKQYKLMDNPLVLDREDLIRASTEWNKAQGIK